MIAYVALLRGINVSGQKMIAMKDLRALCESEGFSGVRTYLQSGNVHFESAGKPAALRKQIEAAVAKRFGFDVPTLVIPRESLAGVIAANPFATDSTKDPERFYVGFLMGDPTPELLSTFTLPAGDAGTCYLAGQIAYLHLPAGYGTSKLNNNYLERKLKVAITTRNWKTVNALATG